MLKIQKSCSKEVLFVAALASLALLSASCGTSSQAIPAHQAISQTQNPFDPSRPLSDIGAIPASTFSALKGTYRGTMNGWDESYEQVLSQEYTIALSERESQGKRYAFAQFRSSGPIGDFSFDTALGAGLINYAGQYSFASAPFDSSAFSVSKIQLLMVLRPASSGADGSGSPAQSTIRIMDCGFSQIVCSSPLQDVWFQTN